MFNIIFILKIFFFILFGLISKMTNNLNIKKKKNLFFLWGTR
ncbi:hypothetical protein DDB_G0275771 [Dictyostelium discoideum AX4]|uniref:Uncharacterized protein n=1 Tax=Dictyostelium discoideum TaxID=44689 RepID=Q553C8_DICDI|nr:hypothetical protein DDB_G0275771 [Dictyostelium discoideum AX4]EAL69636.1 hypothetical protein DDB_G0275771 [Dictyostelium discoideum AX4]|eukprot:XP_643490.1 hypothetical protein DDB_G0275771 [Dictyostelium discoideum AX4]